MTAANQMIENQQVVQALWDAVNTSAGNLATIKPLIRKILKTEPWKERLVPQLGAEPVRFKSLVEFIQTPPLRGCGWPPEKIPALIKDDAKLLTDWRRATTASVGKPGHNSDNITISDGRGTSLAYTLDRLEREYPDLFSEVVAKRLSANKAAIKAGFRKPRLAPFDQILKLLPKLTPEERRKLRFLLEEMP